MKELKKNMIAVLLVLISSGSFAQNNFNLDSAKHAFTWKKRRIINNNDGSDVQYRAPIDTASPQSFLRRRFVGLKGSQVDAISYCDGFLDKYTHRSDKTEIRRKMGKYDLIVDYLFKNDTDPLNEVVNFCRENNLDIFWSMRMNDDHDFQDNNKMPTWKKENPDALMGKKGDQFSHRSTWTALNYENYKVRRYQLEVIEDVVSRYDIDGIELDFFRHLWLFRETLNGKPATSSQLALMTGFIHDIRDLLDDYSRRKKKPLLLIIRVPDSFEYCETLGIDLEEWLSKKYVDLLVTSGYFKLNSYDFLARVGKEFNVPVYPCFTPRRIHNGGGVGDKTDLVKWRSEAYTALNAGVSGIYIFNRFFSYDDVYDEIGTLESLESLEREDNFESYICETCWFKPQRWIKNGDRFIKTGDKYLEEILSKKKTD